MLWSLLRLMDGQRTTTEILFEFPDAERADVVEILGKLAAVGVSTPLAGRFVVFSTQPRRRESSPAGSWMLGPL